MNPDLPATLQCGDCIALPRSCLPRMYRTQLGDTWAGIAGWLHIPAHRLRSRNRDAVVRCPPRSLLICPVFALLFALSIRSFLFSLRLALLSALCSSLRSLLFYLRASCTYQRTGYAAAAVTRPCVAPPLVAHLSGLCSSIRSFLFSLRLALLSALCSSIHTLLFSLRFALLCAVCGGLPVCVCPFLSCGVGGVCLKPTYTKRGGLISLLLQRTQLISTSP